MNLTYYVRNKFTKIAFFDYASFYDDVQIATRMMDTMIDLEIEKLDKIIEKIKNDITFDETYRNVELELWQKIKDTTLDTRRIGLGLTGLADAIAMLNFSYNNEEIVIFTECIYETLAVGSYKASINMAKTRGSFRIFDIEKDKFI